MASDQGTDFVNEIFQKVKQIRSTAHRYESIETPENRHTVCWTYMIVFIAFSNKSTVNKRISADFELIMGSSSLC